LRAAATLALPNPFWDSFAPVEALQLWVSAYGVHGGLAPEKTQQWVALFTQSAQSLLTAAGIFAGDYPHVAHQRFAVKRPRRVT